MENSSRIKYIPIIIFLILTILSPDSAYSAGTPVVIPGTVPPAFHLGAVRLREFTSGGNKEIFLGVPFLDLGGAHRTEMDLTWSSANTITFTYDPVLDKLTTSVDNGSANWSLEYTEFSTNVRDLVYEGDQAAADYALSHLNYMQIDVTLRGKPPAQVSLDDVQLDGIPLGNFSGVYLGTESWYVDGYDFSAGFSFTGVLNLSGITNPSPQLNNVEIILGSIGVDVPVISNLIATPNPVVPGGGISLTATATDSGTNNIQSAEYNLESGPWNPMSAQDGTFDSPAEDLIAAFSAPVDHGVVYICVRATNALNNTGQEGCAALSVDGQGPLTSNLQVVPNPVTSGGDVTLTATVDDSTTGISNIQSAEYSLAGGPWNPLNAQDGSFDSPSEDVEATFAVPNPSGDYAFCVRGKDILGNIGPAACTQLTVSEEPNESVIYYYPLLFNQPE
jgi:hypothetical protein